MKTTTLTHTILFEAPLALAYDFVTTWDHWPMWYPATQSVECAPGPARLGTSAVERVKKLGLHGTVRWKVLECDPPRRFAMEATEIEMPLFGGVKMRITYDFSAEAGRTRLDRTWTYELPTAMLELLNRITLRRNLALESERALLNLKRLLEARVKMAA